MVSPVDQTIDSKKIFKDIEVANPADDNDAVNKSYVDSELAKQRIAHDDMFVERSGDTMTGDLIPVQSQPYPTQGNTNKAVSLISIEQQLETYFYRVKNHFQWRLPLI